MSLLSNHYVLKIIVRPILVIAHFYHPVDSVMDGLLELLLLNFVSEAV